jgi:hypothetical protein
MTDLSAYTDKKENKIFLIYEIQSGAVAKSNMRKGFLIYEEMRKYFPIYEEAVSHIWLCNCSILNFPIYEENLIFFFISVVNYHSKLGAIHIHCPIATDKSAAPLPRTHPLPPCHGHILGPIATDTSFAPLPRTNPLPHCHGHIRFPIAMGTIHPLPHCHGHIRCPIAMVLITHTHMPRQPQHCSTSHYQCTANWALEGAMYRQACRNLDNLNPAVILVTLGA